MATGLGTGADPARWWARIFGALFLVSAAANLVLLLLDHGAYDGFADRSIAPWFTDAWRSVFVPHASLFIGLLFAFEATVGVLVLRPRSRRAGIVAAMAFTVALVCFGWGFLLWSVPVAVALGRFFVLARQRPDPGQAASPTARSVNGAAADGNAGPVPTGRSLTQ